MKHGFKVFLEHYKSKEHWYIKYIIWGIISVVCFAILIQILKEVGVPTAQKIFDFFTQWAMVLSATATLLLAGTAFWAIMDNRHSRIVERRERLLNEIIDWAIDIAKTETQGEFLLESRKSMLIDLLLKYQAVDARSEYIKVIAAEFGEDFQAAVNKTAKKLEEHLDILKKQIEGKITAEERDRHYRSLLEITLTLTKKTAKIKTKDIGH